MANTAAHAHHGHDHKHDHPHDHKGHDHGPGQPELRMGGECCSHHEIELERWIVVYLIGGMLVLTTTIARFLGSASEIALIPAGIGALLLGFPLFLASFQEVKRGRPTSSTLASLAIIAALATGRYETAGFLAFILLIADQVVRRTAWGAQRAIEQLVGLTPDTARIVDASGAERDATLGEVQVGMTVRVRPGENLPVDGVVIKGESSINQASLTGEAVPAEVDAGKPVFAGTTNLTGTLDIRATNVGADTTIGKVTQLIREAESSRTPRQLLIEQVAAYFVPVAISTAGLVWYLMAKSDDPLMRDRATVTAITILVVVCPSALLLASPTAMVASFAAAARLGIMIKQASYLEAAANIDTVVFDKTGTITTGVFAVGRLAPATGVEGVDLLQSAADAEQQSNHPLARSILTTARQARVQPANVDKYVEVHGRGVKATVGGDEILAGRSAWLLEMRPDLKGEIDAVEAKIDGMTGVHVMRRGQYLGAVGLEDRIRPNAKTVVERVRELGARQVALFTGDRFGVAKRVGQAVGVDRVEAECLPEEKHDLILRLRESGRRVMMVGDGINDGPSLAASDVGVAMGAGGSDIATNSAGVALMRDDLSRIPFLIELARRTRAIIAQNIVASIVIAVIGLILAATGSLAIGFAVVYHFVGDIFVIGNSFRLVRFGENFADTTTPTQRERQGVAGGLRKSATLAGAGA